MSTDDIVWNLRELEEAWARRRARVAAVRRSDGLGVSWPQRNPGEAAWLTARGDVAPTFATSLGKQGSTP